MEDEVRKALDERILAELEEISKMESGCEVKRAAVDDLTAIYKLRLEEIKLENDYNAKLSELNTRKNELCEKNDSEEKRFKMELKNDWIKKVFDFVGTGFSVGVPLIFYNVWMYQGLEFEKEGVLKSGFFKNFLHCIKPTK